MGTRLTFKFTQPALNGIFVTVYWTLPKASRPSEISSTFFLIDTNQTDPYKARGTKSSRYCSITKKAPLAFVLDKTIIQQKHVHSYSTIKPKTFRRRKTKTQALSEPQRLRRYSLEPPRHLHLVKLGDLEGKWRQLAQPPPPLRPKGILPPTKCTP